MLSKVITSKVSSFHSFCGSTNIDSAQEICRFVSCTGSKMEERISAVADPHKANIVFEVQMEDIVLQKF